MIGDFFDGALSRDSVYMHIKDRHEDADLYGRLSQIVIIILDMLHLQYSAVGRASTALCSATLFLLGSLKKKIMKTQILPAKTDKNKRPRYEQKKVTPALTTMKGMPSLANGHLFLMRESSNLLCDNV